MVHFFIRKLRHTKNVSGVFTFSEAGADFFRREVPQLNVTVLPVPIDTVKFNINASKKWLPHGRLRIIMNARFVAYKRHIDLFFALAQLRRQNIPFSLTCISRDSYGQDKLLVLVKRLGVEPWVTFLWARPMEEVISLYHQHDVLVLPSYNEAIGLAVPEAMACGLPTITSDTVGANVYVIPNETGLIVKTGIVEEITQALIACTEINRLEAMGQKARVRSEEFAVPFLVAQFKHLLQTILL